MPKYRHKARVDLYEKVPEKKSGNWIAGAILIVFGLMFLAQCVG